MSNLNMNNEMILDLDGDLFKDFRIKLNREVNNTAMQLKDRKELEDVEVTAKIKIREVEQQLSNGDWVKVPKIDCDISSKMSVVNKTSCGIYFGNKYELVEEKGQMKLRRIINPQMSLKDCE